ncbi:hypothetical protein AB4Y45_09140 [Paraburkholderia sp. EG287A]|uniref:hypothetical protein n=1 Tax=Paraburkholderia sp. EG287A TaxID=3237012 RepID=UPI0034D15DCC
MSQVKRLEARQSGAPSERGTGVVHSGPVVRVASNDTFGFATAYGVNSRGQSATAISSASSIGDKYAKAILSSTDGHGLRCDLVGQFPTAGGICVDDQRRVYDVVMVAK